MRGLALAVAALMVSAVPAQAAWQYYACPSDNFASQFPGVPKMENVRFSMPRHGLATAAHSYTTTVDNIVYRMVVADYSDRAADGASILEEAMFQHTEADDHDRGWRDEASTQPAQHLLGTDQGQAPSDE